MDREEGRSSVGVGDEISLFVITRGVQQSLGLRTHCLLRPGGVALVDEFQIGISPRGDSRKERN